MGRRLFVCMTALASLLLWACPQVWAQCSSYSINAPTAAMLTPAQYAQGGSVVATVNVSAADGSLASGNMTAGAGTQININFSSSNASSLTMYFSLDNGSKQQTGRQPGTDPSPWLLTLPSSWAGHVVNFYLAGTGYDSSTTQDVAHLTVTTQAPGIYSADRVPNNYYLQYTSTFGGPAAMQQCQLCQNQPAACTNANHAPFSSSTLTNDASGEVNIINRQQSGQTASPYTSLSGSITHAISVRPGDPVHGGPIHQITCPIMGVLWELSQLFHFDVEVANTTSQVLWNTKGTNKQGHNFYDAVASCPVVNPPDKPPDSPGPDVFFDFDPISTGYVRTAIACFRWNFSANDLKGQPWYCTTNTVQRMESTMGQGQLCTLKDNGWNPPF